jgi:hypothetical protein
MSNTSNLICVRAGMAFPDLVALSGRHAR